MLIWFAETTLVASILAVVALVGGRWRRIGPVGRHALWLVVLIKFVAPPIVSWPTPVIVLPLEATEPERPAVSVGDNGVGPELLCDDGCPACPAASRSRHAPRAVLVCERHAERAYYDNADPISRSEGSKAAKPLPDSRFGASAWIRSIRLDLEAIRRSIVLTWAWATAAVVLACSYRVARFRRHLRGAVCAPPWFENEAREVARAVGVRVPEILVIPATTTPMLWCLGRPRLLLPARLVDTLRVDSWRGILAHELAHLRRRDHWVRRLELLAGLFWWWNPLYWLTLSRLEAEAELACDECAVRAFPKGRLAYAEALLKVCQSLSPAVPPAPALGAAGSGRFLERRVTMILRDPVPSRASTPVLFGAVLLSLVAIPGWSAAGPVAKHSDNAPAPAPAPAPAIRPAAPAPITLAMLDDEDDDDKRESRRRAERKEQEARSRADSARRSSRPDREDALEDDERAEKARAKAKEMAERGERIAREMEKKFGPGSEFQKKMESFGKEMEKKFGPDSDFAREMEKKFGPGSEFQKSMESLSKEMEKKFGPDSDFARDMKEKFGPDSDFARDMKKKFGPDSDFARDMKEKFGPDSDFARDMKEKKAAAKSDSAKGRGDFEFDARFEKKTSRGDESTDDDTPKGNKAGTARKPVKESTADAARSKSRARQIEEIQRQLQQLSRQLRALQDEDGAVEDRRR